MSYEKVYYYVACFNYFIGDIACSNGLRKLLFIFILCDASKHLNIIPPTLEAWLKQ